MTTDLRDIAKRYASIYPRINDEEGRHIKGQKVAAVLEDHLGPRNVHCVIDLGASNCVVLSEVARRLRPDTAIGVDLDGPSLSAAPEGIITLMADIASLPIPDACADVVICNHVYEHVPDASILFVEMERVLKPGGCIYLAAMNAFWPMEPHYHLPFLHWLPVWMTRPLLRARGYPFGYLERPLTYPELKRLTARFQRRDYTLRVISNPTRFHADELFRGGRMSPKNRTRLAKAIYPFLPSYIWVLVKPRTA